MGKSNKVTINSRKYNGEVKKSWEADLIEIDNSLLILYGEFDKEITHEHLGVVKRGTKSYEFYWLNRFYNVFRFHEPGGEFRNFYCNINLPPTFENNVLDYVDLEIDLIVYRDFSYKILDEDEFIDNSRIYNYPKNLIKKTRETIEEVLSIVDMRQFPFDFQI